MNGQLNHMIAQQRVRSGVVRALQHTETAVDQTRFTLHARHIARLDRFVGQAQRAARRAEREFEGVSIEVDDQGTVSVHATGMMSMLLEPVASLAPHPRPLERDRAGELGHEGCDTSVREPK
jgi:hypothetical protein